LLVSLDGTAEANHQRPFVSGLPSHAAVVRNIPRFLKWVGPHRLSVRMTFFPDDHSLDFVRNLKFIQDLGVRKILLCPVVELDWQGWESKLEAAYHDLAEWFIEEMRARRNPGAEITWRYLHLHYRAVTGGPKELARPCSIGKELIGINHLGNILPCHRHNDKPHAWLGHVKQKRFPEERNQYLHLNSRDIERCADCPRWLCGGGCRVLSMQAGHGLHGHHPNHCLLLRCHAQAVAHIYQTLMAERNRRFQNLLRVVNPGCGSNIQHLA
jgi:radical SAM protein with 4Fe4S-binding SPASM domain